MAGFGRLSFLILVVSGVACLQSELHAPHHVIRYEGEALAATEAMAAAVPLSCDQSFDLHLRFQGISQLVSERVARPSNRELWVLFPKTDHLTPPANVPKDLVFDDDRHEPNLFFLPSTVRTALPLKPPPQPCPFHLPGCAAVNLTGLHVETPSGSGPTMDWSPWLKGGTSLRLVADQDRLTGDALSAAGADKGDFSSLLSPTVAGAPLMARFRATMGHVQTSAHWKGEIRFARRGLKAVRKYGDLARSFELIVPVAGCLNLSLRDLGKGQSAGTVTVGSPTGADVHMVIDHHPTSNAGCMRTENGHFLAHYLFRDVSSIARAEDLVGLVVPGASSPCSNPQCSPSCSEWP